MVTENPDYYGSPRVGPGPAKYQLPTTVGHVNHDGTRHRSPSYSMGSRLPGIFCDSNLRSISPGPKYAVGHLTKYGKINVPVLAYYPRISPRPSGVVQTPKKYEVEVNRLYCSRCGEGKPEDLTITDQDMHSEKQI